MKKSGSYLVRAAVAIAGGPGLILSVSAQTYPYPSKDLPSVYESYDNNVTGVVLPSSSSGAGTITRGYGIRDRYSSIGAFYSGAIQVVTPGLAFGTLTDGTGKCVQIDSQSDQTATGFSVKLDPGKATGDTDFYFYDKLYCSYLVRYSAVSGSTGTSTTSAPRGELRVNSNGTVGLQVHSDSHAAGGNLVGAVQPALSYSGSNYTYAPSPTTQVLDSPTSKTYMMISRFTQVGNYLGATPNGTWTLGAESVVVSSASNIAIGQYVKGAGIAPNTRVTGTSGTTIYLSEATTAAGNATALNFSMVVADRDLSAKATWANNTKTLTGASPAGDFQKNMVITGPGIPAGTVIDNVSGSTITISKNTTATGNATTVTLNSIKPITASYGNGATTITIDRHPTFDIRGYDANPRLAIGAYVEGPGIQPGTYVTDISDSNPPYILNDGTEITLSKPTTGGASDEEVTFFMRVGTSTLYSLSEAQYDYFTALEGGMTETDLDTATIGTANNQVTVRIEGPVQTSGSMEFMPGRDMQLVGYGGSTGRQTFKMDEIRYGFTFKGVTQPALPEPSTPNVAEDQFNSHLHSEPFDGGYGWKTGYYQVEETASTQGAYCWYSPPAFPGLPLSPGSGGFMNISLRYETDQDQGVRRRPDPAVVDMEQPYTVNFEYRLNGGGGDFDSFGDRIQIGADGPPGNTVNFGPNPSDSINLTWLVGVVGGDDGTPPNNREIPAMKWWFYDYGGFSKTINGNTNYYIGANMVDTGIFFNQTKTYRFKIEVDAPNFIYHATVTEIDSETGTVINSFSARDLHFRVDDSKTHANAGKAHSIFWGGSKPKNVNRVFALDNLRVSQGIEPVDPFPAWIAAASPGVPAELQGRTVDADNDGRPNFLEFALDGNPGSGAASGKERVQIANISGTNYHTLTIPVRTGLAFNPIAGPPAVLRSEAVNGITYEIQGSYDLVNFTQQPVLVAPGDVPASITTGLPTLGTTPAPGWEYKTFRLPAAAGTQPKGFLRAVITNQ